MGAQAALAGRTGFVFGVPIRRDIDGLFERAHAEFDPDAFDRAWEEGQTFSIEQAGALALDGLEQLE
jgi:hypothetical protein